MWLETHLTETPSMSFEDAQEYLQAIVPDEQRWELDRLLEKPMFQGADISFFQVYDIGAEVVGDDLMVITPQGSSDAFVAQISYVHA